MKVSTYRPATGNTQVGLTQPDGKSIPGIMMGAWMLTGTDQILCVQVLTRDGPVLASLADIRVKE